MAKSIVMLAKADILVVALMQRYLTRVLDGSCRHQNRVNGSTVILRTLIESSITFLSCSKVSVMHRLNYIASTSTVMTLASSYLP